MHCCPYFVKPRTLLHSLSYLFPWLNNDVWLFDFAVKAVHPCKASGHSALRSHKLTFVFLPISHVHMLPSLYLRNHTTRIHRIRFQTSPVPLVLFPLLHLE